MDAFWPEAAPAAARNSLNVAVHGLRQAFRSSAEVPVVVLEDGTYRLGGLAFDRHQYGACVTLGRLMVERDPCREDGHRRLMRCFARQGQPHLALRPYLACAEALDRELGSTPTRPPSPWPSGSAATSRSRRLIPPLRRLSDG